jgi:hypothetical protein
VLLNESQRHFCAKAINRNVPTTRVLDEWIFVETIHLRLLMEYVQNRRLKIQITKYNSTFATAKINNSNMYLLVFNTANNLKQDYSIFTLYNQ